MTGDDADERLFLVGQIPATVQGRPGEALKRPLIVDPRTDPEQIFATPTWRREPTTEFDPRKGR